MAPFVYPRISSSKFVSWNEEMFARYTNERVYHHPNPIIRFVEHRRVQTLLNLMKPFNDSDHILAAGCGEGFIETQITNGQVTLVDISTEAIKRAKSKVYQTPNVTFHTTDLEKLALKPGSFNKIECSEVIEHVYSPGNLLKELHRVLTPDGILAISFPNEPFINFLKKIFIRLHVFNLFFPNIPPDMTEEWHLRPMSLAVFKEFIKTNWRILSVRPVPFFFIPIRYVVLCCKSSSDINHR
jgi:2-polyprenyl-3-methyl-5-hydroxy-6-metoxy-1,4-benzoquinol methylase